ncbi:uncharacterized transmembrane protein [Lates japonicus]|uniref:Uncharacterized transmembrane protein n=1 Tax=Lates japonicus TaxID=270547 RepID=A0AAD3MY37_LATJO|nr:uncharacterized transmembrane protein [Lates japonicus]
MVQQAHLPAQDHQLKPEISAGTMSQVGNTKDITVDSNSGKIGSDNSIGLKGCTGSNASVGNTSGINIGDNSGSVGSGNSIDMQGGLGHNASEIRLTSTKEAAFQQMKDSS